VATPAVTNTLANGNTVDADELNENFTDLVDFLDDEVVHVDATKAFTGIPTLPASDPTTANQATRKSYVDALNTAQTAALATHHDAASTDHDDRYFTEAEITARVATLIGNTSSTGTAAKVAIGASNVTFSGNPASAASATITTGLTAISNIQLTPITVGVVLAVNSSSGGDFTVIGSTITDIDYSGTVTFYWLAFGT